MSRPRESYLLVWFYKQKKQDVRDVCSGAIINILVTKLDPPFCHVELAFEDGMAVGVTKNDAVYMRRRTFDPVYYTCIKVSVSLQVADKAKLEAESRIGEKFGFLRKDATFCSHLVGQILKNSKAIEDLEISTLMSPSALYKRILSHTIALDSVRPRYGPMYGPPIGFKCELAHLLQN
jgi:hypothetical protein